MGSSLHWLAGPRLRSGQTAPRRLQRPHGDIPAALCVPYLPRELRLEGLRLFKPLLKLLDLPLYDVVLLAGIGDLVLGIAQLGLGFLGLGGRLLKVAFRQLGIARFTTCGCGLLFRRVVPFGFARAS